MPNGRLDKLPFHQKPQQSVLYPFIKETDTRKPSVHPSAIGAQSILSKVKTRHRPSICSRGSIRWSKNRHQDTVRPSFCSRGSIRRSENRQQDNVRSRCSTRPSKMFRISNWLTWFGREEYGSHTPPTRKTLLWVEPGEGAEVWEGAKVVGEGVVGEGVV
jgi:hypothetical protein